MTEWSPPTNSWQHPLLGHSRLQRSAQAWEAPPKQPMTALEALGIFGAGIGAGMINTVVGSGSLITFPTLVAFGLPPVSANVSNTVGLVPGSASGAIGYRRELVGQTKRVARLAAVSAIGGLGGGLLLLSLPQSAFRLIVPILIILAVLLFIAQPWLSRFIYKSTKHRKDDGWLLLVLVFCSGIYGGYFGAAQGVILMAILGSLVNDSLQRLNAAKNVAAGVVNLVAALFFVFAAPVNWLAALMVAGGATIGGTLGASVGRRLPPLVLRGVVVVVGLVAAIRLL
jgi:uncharacterized protein